MHSELKASFLGPKEDGRAKNGEDADLVAENRLSLGQVIKVANRYIGVTEGYLGDFSYRTHADFYPEYCDLEYDPNKITGTTRERFIEILSKAPAEHQAKILRGVIQRFPVGSGPATRTDDLREEILKWADALYCGNVIPSPDIKSKKAVVERALADAEELIKTTGAPSSVDRIHTALHGYLQELCIEGELKLPDGDGISAFFKVLRERHPIFREIGPHSGEITKALNSAGAMIDALNCVRNNGSVAHPNEELLEPAEAMLFVNLTRSMLHYLADKLS